MQLNKYKPVIWDNNSYEYNILHVIYSQVSNTKYVWTWYRFHVIKPFDSCYLHLEKECVLHNEMEPTIWIHMNLIFYMLFITMFLSWKMYETNIDFMVQSYSIHIISILKRNVCSISLWRTHSFSRCKTHELKGFVIWNRH